MFSASSPTRPRSYSDDFLLPDLQEMEKMSHDLYDTQQLIPEDRWDGYNDASQLIEIPPPPPAPTLSTISFMIPPDHPDAWMMSVTDADWARITASLEEEQRIQKMRGVSLLLPISNRTNAKKRNAAINFVDQVFSSRNLRRKTHDVQDTWEGSENAIQEEINAILQFIQENAKKTPA